MPETLPNILASTLIPEYCHLGTPIYHFNSMESMLAQYNRTGFLLRAPILPPLCTSILTLSVLFVANNSYVPAAGGPASLR